VGIVCESMAHAWLAGHERDVEKAVIGRRHRNTEIDLLGAAGARAERADADRPTSDELLDAVAAFLRDHVVPGNPRKPVAFHARVAATRSTSCGARWRWRRLRKCSSMPRWRKAARPPTRATHARLNGALCERIASGATDLDTPGLRLPGG